MITFSTYVVLILSISLNLKYSVAVEECLYPELGFGDSCYFFAGNIILNWPNAEASCRKWGGDIVAIDNEEENDFVVNVMLHDYNISKFWIGLSSYEVFEWTTEEENEEMTQFDPKPFPVHCVFSDAFYGTNSTRAWLNEKCHIEKPFVCERLFREPSTTPVYTTEVPSPIISTTPSPSTGAPPRPPIGVTLPPHLTAGPNVTWVTSVYDPNQANDPTYIPATGYPPQGTTDSNGNTGQVDPDQTSVTGSCAQIWSARLGADFDGAVSYYSIEDRIHPTCIIKPSDSIKFADRDEAKKWCEERTNGHLVAVQTIHKFNFINGEPFGDVQDKPIIGTYTGLYDYWIGLQRRLQYIWNNGMINTDMSYTPLGVSLGVKSCFYAGYNNGKWHEESDCVTTVGTSPAAIGFLCETSACPAGFRSELYYDHVFKTEIFGCFEYDACADHEICGSSNAGQCIPSDVNVTGTLYTCNCSTGYTNSGGNIRGPCVDINECEDEGFEHGACNGLGECVNFEGTYTCNCVHGTRFDDFRMTCVDVDECAQNPDICVSGNCVNTISGYSCDCAPGFTSIYGVCHDINECFETTFICGPGSLECVNINGFDESEGGKYGYKCICNVGYEFNDIMCMDVDECDMYENYCQDSLATCINEIGFAACKCPLDNVHELVFDYGTMMCGPPNVREAYLESLSNLSETRRRKRKIQPTLLKSYDEPSNLRFMRNLLSKF